MVTISIPVKKHVKKYLVRKYGEVHTVSKRSFLGVLILQLLNDKVEASDVEFLGFEKYTLDIPELYFNTKGYKISREKRQLLGICLERLFIEDFHTFVDVELAKGNNNAWQSVKLFLALNNISENEIKLESMYRNYQRHCGEKIKEKKSSKIVHS